MAAGHGDAARHLPRQVVAGAAAGSGREAAGEPEAPPVRLFLLGGFRAEREGAPVPDAAWKRRTAKALVKLLAVEPSHRLHREHAIELLWPELGAAPTANRLYKALQAARQALEGVPSRAGGTSILHLAGDVVALDTDHITVDADRFEALSREGLDGGDIEALEAALDAYGGQLLPEDRYEEWAIERREALQDLHSRLLVALADALAESGSWEPAIDRLRQALSRDRVREDIHRRLMRLYAVTGRRQQALRQYQICREALRQELDAEPDPETDELHREILAGGVGAGRSAGGVDRPPGPLQRLPPLPSAVSSSPALPFIGRDEALRFVLAELQQADVRRGGLLLMGGEAGVGKTRLAQEAARAVHSMGALVLWGAGYEEEGPLAYGPFAEALGGYLDSLPAEWRERVVGDYPELTQLPSIGEPALGSGENPNRERPRLFTGAVRFLAGLAAEGPVLLVLDDLHAADPESLQLLHHLARLAPGHRWLLLGAYREESVGHGSPLQRLAAWATGEGLCRRLDLRRLGRQDCDRLVESLLPGGTPAPDLLAHVYTLSLGNPLYAQELVQAARERGEVGLDGGIWRLSTPAAEVPGHVRDLVEARVDQMDEDTRRALALAAVAGMESLYADLREAAPAAFGRPIAESDLLDALDRALEARVLEEREHGYAFRHPLVRVALYERLSRSRRSQLHRALAEAVQRIRPADVEALAYHHARGEHALEAAGADDTALGDDREARQTLPTGADETRNGEGPHHR